MTDTKEYVVTIPEGATLKVHAPTSGTPYLIGLLFGTTIGAMIGGAATAYHYEKKLSETPRASVPALGAFEPPRPGNKLERLRSTDRTGDKIYVQHAGRIWELEGQSWGVYLSSDQIREDERRLKDVERNKKR